MARWSPKAISTARAICATAHPRTGRPGHRDRRGIGPALLDHPGDDGRRRRLDHVQGISPYRRQERARELFTLCHAAQRGAVRPVMTVRDLRMINTWRTSIARPAPTSSPRCRKPNAATTSFQCPSPMAFPGATCPRPAPRSWSSAMTRRPPERRWPKISPSSAWRTREGVNALLPTVPAAVDSALALPEGEMDRVVRADVADNAGGGAPSDLTFILQHLLDRGVLRRGLRLLLGSGGRTLLFRGRRRRHAGPAHRWQMRPRFRPAGRPRGDRAPVIAGGAAKLRRAAVAGRWAAPTDQRRRYRLILNESSHPGLP